MSFVVRGYGRASTDKQALSTSAQHEVCLKGFELNKLARPDWAEAVWGGWYADEATMRTSEFRCRHQASLLLATCQPGDLIIAAKFDRTFVNAADVHNTLRYLNDSQIRIKVLDIDIDTTSPLGECLFKILAAVKELEVNEIRARTAAMARHRRNRGLPAGRAPFGYKNVKVRLADGTIRSWMVPDHQVRRYAEKLYAIAAEHGCLPAKRAAKLFNELKLRKLSGKKWFESEVWQWFHAYKNDWALPPGYGALAPIPPDGEIVEMKAVKPDA